MSTAPKETITTVTNSAFYDIEKKCVLLKTIIKYFKILKYEITILLFICIKVTISETSIKIYFRNI